MTNLERLNQLTEELPDLEALETYIGGPAVLFNEAKDITHVGFGAYRDRDIAMMRTFAKAGAALESHVHVDEHEWIGVISGVLEIYFQDTGEIMLLRELDLHHITPGRPHSTKALEDTHAWTITIPPAAGYPTLQSCPMVARAQINAD